MDEIPICMYYLNSLQRWIKHVCVHGKNISTHRHFEIMLLYMEKDSKWLISDGEEIEKTNELKLV